jgi:dinuclear metal center YbgI/SA1388 family protein
VSKVVCGVSASRELFERAAAAGAQLVLVHHGIFWRNEPQRIDARMRGRLETLFAADMSLAGYHLALDAHAELSDSAQLAAALGVAVEAPFEEHGVGGRLPEPVRIEAFLARTEDVLGRAPLAFTYGPSTIERVAIMSGGGGGYFLRAAQAGFDLFLTGEPTEPALHSAKELGVHFVAGGHYATERRGIQALTRRIAERFGLEWEFVDLPTPV